MIRSMALSATRSISVSVQIPVAVDRLAEGKVAAAFTAALFIKDADQLLKGPAFHVMEPLAGVGDELIDRAEIDGGNGSGEGDGAGSRNRGCYGKAAGIESVSTRTRGLRNA